MTTRILPGQVSESDPVEVGYTFEISGPAGVRIRHRIRLPAADQCLAAAVEAPLARRLDVEHAQVRRLAHWFLRIAQWKQDRKAAFDRLLEQDVAMHMDIESDETRFVVTFRAEYIAADLDPLMHPVTFATAESMPSADDLIRRLDREWEILERIFALAQAADSGGAVTRAVPPPFVESTTRGSQAGRSRDRDMTPLARMATPEEAKRLTEHFLDAFRFPFEIEEDGVNYGFIPRVELGENAIQLIVSMLMPPKSGDGTLRMGGSKAVEIPFNEIFVHGGELNRRTKEGILEIVKGLCRTIGKKRGLTAKIDITRPR